MKYLIFAIALLASIHSQAYLVKGVRTTILVEGTNRYEIKDISLEGCDKDTCSKPKKKSKCIEDGPLKFYCHLKDQYPSFVRFTVRFNGNKLLSSKFISTNGESSLNNFKLNVTDSAVTAKPIKDIL